MLGVLGRMDWDQPLVSMKINGAVQISSMSGLSTTYHSMSCDQLCRSLHRGVVLLNLSDCSGLEATEEVAGAG